MVSTYSTGYSTSEPYTEEKFQKQLKNPDVVKVCVYKPGETVVMSDRTYKVGNAGNLVRQR